MHIDQRTLDVANLYNEGMPIIEIGKQLGMTPLSVEKRMRTYKRFQSGNWKYNKKTVSPLSNTPSSSAETWTIENLKTGFERFISENGRPPTAYDIDDCDYLPSSRHMQRKYGGLGKLRELLGYGNIVFNAGDSRRETLKITGIRGTNAEDKVEEILIEKFGRVYVHSEQRYGGSRKRVDFVVYAKGITFAIDVFATEDIRMLGKNIDVKLPKYKSFPSTSPLIFLLISDVITQDDINKVVDSRQSWKKYQKFTVVTLESLIKLMEKSNPLPLPDGYKPI
jgi:hypothetical protein